MRAVTRCLGSVGLCIVSGVGVLAAQHQGPLRQGFWGTFGLGVGSAALSCGSGCSFNSDVKGAGLTVDIKLGGTPSPRLRLGGEMNFWLKDVSATTGVSGETETVGNFSGVAYFYPSRRGGFFVKGGVGVAIYQLSQGNTHSTATGPGIVGGLGYDIHLGGGQVSLIPVLNLFSGKDGDLKESGTVLIPSIGHSVIAIGLGVQYN